MRVNCLTFSRLLLLIILVAAQLLAAGGSARAAIITVGGDCTLEAAIIAANTNSDGACAGAVDGAYDTPSDYIVLEANQTYAYNTAWGNPFNQGNTALPPITSTLTISGNNATLVRDQTLNCPAASADQDFRFFTLFGKVGSPIQLTLFDITLMNGCANSPNGSVQSGGAIRGVDATLAIITTTLVNNQATASGGAISLEGGAAGFAMSGSTVASNQSGLDGGGIHAVQSGNSSNLIVGMMGGSQVNNNESGGKGGGIYLESQSNNDSLINMVISASEVLTNSSQGDGGGLYVLASGANGGVALNAVDSKLNANTSHLGEGGGFYVESAIITNSTQMLTLMNTELLSNTSQGNGGGFHSLTNGDTGVVNLTLSNTRVEANRSQQGAGGGFYVEDSSTQSLNTFVTLASSKVLTNTSQEDGGGFATLFTGDRGLMNVSLSNTRVEANTSQQGAGGGFYIKNAATEDSTTNIGILSSMVLTNTSQGNGGGFHILGEGELVTVTLVTAAGTIDANQSEEGAGGGLYVENAATESLYTSVVLDSTNVQTNTSQGDGGGMLVKSEAEDGETSAIITGVLFQGNHSQGNGGAIAYSSPYSNSLVMQNNRFLSNVAAQGAALYAQTKGGLVNNNCFVNNFDHALTYTGDALMDATNNWWGAPDGPSGAFPGSGDAALGNLTVAPFQLADPSACGTLQTDVVAVAEVNPASATPLLPGQPVTFTTVVTSNGPSGAHTVVVTQLVESDYGFSNVISSTVSELSAGESERVPLGIVIPDNLTATHLLTYTQVISNRYDTTANERIVITRQIVPPTVFMAAANASVDESDDLQLTVQMDQANPYADSIVSIATSDGSALAGEDYTAINQNFVIDAGQSSTLIAIPIEDDNVIEGDENFLVTLGAVSGVRLGTPATTTVTISETAPDAALVMTKTLGIEGITPACTNLTERKVPVGTTVVYCYIATNTGSVPLTNHSLVDSHLGVVPLNSAVVLQPGQSMNTTVTRTLTVSVTNVATWTAQLGGATISQLIDEETVATTGSATLIISAPSDDQDDDTIPDNVEGAADVDGDNVPNFLDDDSDGDGRPDVEEVGPDPNNPLDSNGDGIPDFLDPGDPTGLDPDQQPQFPARLLIPLLENE